MVRQVSRMSTEGEAAPAADAPAEGEPLPEVGDISSVIFCFHIICQPQLLVLPLRESLCLRLVTSSLVSKSYVILIC